MARIQVKIYALPRLQVYDLTKTAVDNQSVVYHKMTSINVSHFS